MNWKVFPALLDRSAHPSAWEELELDGRRSMFIYDDIYYQVRKHLKHAYQLEVVVHGEERITVECTKCGEVVSELYSKEEDQEEAFATCDSPEQEGDFRTRTEEEPH